MATEQTVIFTVIPRGITRNPDTLPLSVLVTPRLGGGTRLGEFEDWLGWARRLRDSGAVFRFTCGTQTYRVRSRPEVIRPDLWEALFDAETLVRPYDFDDYSTRGVVSFSMREALSAIKLVYQEAGVALALPDPEPMRGHEGARGRLHDLVGGLNVEWDPRRAPEWRKQVRAMNAPHGPAVAAPAFSGAIDGEGLYTGPREATAMRRVAMPFSVFHHMPTPEQDEMKVDPDTVFDFHQALTAMNTYPAVQRALGLVFDVEVPAPFVPATTTGTIQTISAVLENVEWSVPTETRSPQTGVVHLAIGADRMFFTAPRGLSGDPAPMTVLGLLDLDPQRFGLAQVDVDGGMHKAIQLSDALHAPANGKHLRGESGPIEAPHAEIYDPDATLPALRSGGLSLFADRRGMHLLQTMKESRDFNDAAEAGTAMKRPFYAEDLVRGFRLDIWDSDTDQWHSLHLRSGEYRVGDVVLETEGEEGFVQFAATMPAPGAPGAAPDTTDMYVHEAIARWSGWSLSVERPGKHLSRHGDPDKAVPPDDPQPDYAVDEPLTPFKLVTSFRVVKGSLPKLRVGTRYRIRARAVDLAGNGLTVEDPLARTLSSVFALSRDPAGTPYLRFEPVESPLLIARDPAALTSPGSALDRLVIRTHNGGIENDGSAADASAADRHIVPPRISIEQGEQLRMFDDESGKLKADAATWKELAALDDGAFHHEEIEIAGKTEHHPIEAGKKIEPLPLLPDLMARGAAIRDLPGSPQFSIARVEPGPGAAAAVPFEPLSDPNPRRGSATLVSFGGREDWRKTVGFRIALAEPAASGADPRPVWSPADRVLTVYLPKGTRKTVALSSYLDPDDLKSMGVWKWVREYMERLAILGAQPKFLSPGEADDLIAHVLQRSVEGGHWMLSPPRLVTLVHAVQQPLGLPRFTALNADVDPANLGANPLQTAPILGRTDVTELAPLTAWRRPGSTDAYLLGAISLHGASTEKVDVFSEWADPVDDPAEPTWRLQERSEHVDEIPLPNPVEGFLAAPGKSGRMVGYYDPENDQIAMARTGQVSRHPASMKLWFHDAAPRHRLHDTRHHRIRYKAQATSRYREYFPEDEELDFTRTSEPLEVRVPASARPLAPDVRYVVPTFGWQRQHDTDIKRSIRFGGGLRIYLGRPWFSSGIGELLGVALYSHQTHGTLDDAKRDAFKSYITQWGMDPIWQTGNLGGFPTVERLPDAVVSERSVSLEERTVAQPDGSPARVDVAGFEVAFDEERGLWFADVTLNTFTSTYMPFVRLALVRYQPDALADAKISPVVLADFAQLTPDRSVVVTSDPHRPRGLRIVISGVAPRGPKVPISEGIRPPHRAPTEFRVRIQERNDAFEGELGWQDVPGETGSVTPLFDAPHPFQPDLALWAGFANFVEVPEPGRYRILIEEFEVLREPGVDPSAERPVTSRLIFAEAIPVEGVR